MFSSDVTQLILFVLDETQMRITMWQGRESRGWLICCTSLLWNFWWLPLKHLMLTISAAKLPTYTECQFVHLEYFGFLLLRGLPACSWILAGDLSASCECCFSIPYPGLWVLMLFAYEILSSFFLFGLPFSFAYNDGFTLCAFCARVRLHRTEAWYIMAECLEIILRPLPVSQNDKPLWLLFIQCRRTCFLVLTPVRYYRLSPLHSSWFYLIPLGFPNVTVAPNCDVESSQGPIIQKRDPPTELSILSESVMDSQVMYILFHTCPTFLGCTK